MAIMTAEEITTSGASVYTVSTTTTRVEGYFSDTFGTYYVDANGNKTRIRKGKNQPT